MLSVSAKTFSAQTKAALQKLDEQITKKQSEVSSGKKKLGLAQDAVEISKINTARNTLTKLDMFSENIESTLTVLRSQDSALTNIGSAFIRLKELALQAKTATVTTEQMKAVSEEVKQIKLNLVHLANTKDQRGNAVFGGTMGSGDAFILNKHNVVQYNGTTDVAEIAVSENQSTPTHINGSEVFMRMQSTGGHESIFAIVEELESFLNSGNKDTDHVLNNLEFAHQQISNRNSQVGANIATLTNKLTINNDNKLEVISSLSKLEDTDLAAVITEIKQLMLTKNATQQIYAKISQQSLFDYIR